MTTISTPDPQWNATISGVTIQGDSAPIALDKSIYSPLTDDINTFIKSSSFQEALQGLSTAGALNIRITINGNRLTIINRDDSNKVLLSKDCDSVQDAPFKQTVKKVNTFATEYIRSITPPPTPLASPSPSLPPPSPSPLPPSPLPLAITISDDQSAALCAEYGVHGIENGNNYCFANTAYQILSNVDSLKTSVMDKLPTELEPLKDYAKIKTGQQLLDHLNHGLTPDDSLASAPFSHGTQYDAGDVLFGVMGQVADFSTPITAVTTQQRIANYPNTQYTTTKPEKLPFIGLVLPSEKSPTIDFQQALNASLSKLSHPDHIVSNETVLFAGIRFETPPNHLFVRVGRHADTTKPKDIRLIDNPQILDLNNSSGMRAGVRANPLYLKGFTVHNGTSTGGHYIAYFQKPHPTDPAKSQWFEANDANVRAITEQEAFECARQASDLYYDDKAPAITATRPRALTLSVDDDDADNFDTTLDSFPASPIDSSRSKQLKRPSPLPPMSIYDEEDDSEVMLSAVSTDFSSEMI